MTRRCWKVQVITNTGGGPASIVSKTGQTFNLGTFYYCNPSINATCMVRPPQKNFRHLCSCA